jgi:hypothetical protein
MEVEGTMINGGDPEYTTPAKKGDTQCPYAIFAQNENYYCCTLIYSYEI